MAKKVIKVTAIPVDTMEPVTNAPKKDTLKVEYPGHLCKDCAEKNQCKATDTSPNPVSIEIGINPMKSVLKDPTKSGLINGLFKKDCVESTTNDPLYIKDGSLSREVRSAMEAEYPHLNIDEVTPNLLVDVDGNYVPAYFSDGMFLSNILPSRQEVFNFLRNSDISREPKPEEIDTVKCLHNKNFSMIARNILLNMSYDINKALTGWLIKYVVNEKVLQTLNDNLIELDTEKEPNYTNKVLGLNRIASYRDFDPTSLDSVMNAHFSIIILRDVTDALTNINNYHHVKDYEGKYQYVVNSATIGYFASYIANFIHIYAINTLKDRLSFLSNDITEPDQVMCRAIDDLNTYMNDINEFVFDTIIELNKLAFAHLKNLESLNAVDENQDDSDHIPWKISYTCY